MDHVNEISDLDRCSPSPCSAWGGRRIAKEFPSARRVPRLALGHSATRSRRQRWSPHWTLAVAVFCQRPVGGCSAPFTALVGVCQTSPSADELATEVLNDPDQRRRYQLSRVVAEHVAAHAGDWGWLRDLVRALNPDPFADHFDHVLPRNGGQLAAQRPASAHTGSRESRRPTLRRTHEAG